MTESLNFVAEVNYNILSSNGEENNWLAKYIMKAINCIGGMHHITAWFEFDVQT